MLCLDLDLDPISVGCDLRAIHTAVRLPKGETLTVRYQTSRRHRQERELRVITGTRARVAAVLRRNGYSVVT